MLQTNHNSLLDHITLNEEDKNILDREMKRLCYFKYITGRFFSLFESSYVD